MTLGEHPDKVDRRYLVSLEHFCNNEFDLGKFHEAVLSHGTLPVKYLPELVK